MRSRRDPALQDPGDLERVVHVPRPVRVLLGLLIALFGLFLLSVMSFALLTKVEWNHDLVLASVVALIFLVIGLTCVYVGARLIVLESDREPLLRRRASHALSGGLAAIGVAALAAALLGGEHWALHAPLAALFLPMAWFVHAKHTMRAGQ